MNKPRLKQVPRTYDEMQQLWGRWGTSLYCLVNESPEEEVAVLIRGKVTVRRQNIRYIDGDGDDIARITRFWFEDGTTDDLIFVFRIQGVVNVLSEW